MTNIWSELYHSGNQPSDKDIADFIGGDLWLDLSAYIQETYSIKPNLSYSNCSMDKGFFRGWNIKYKKSGKALGTFYPKEGYFVALLVIGAKEMMEAELMIPSCTEYVQKLFAESEAVMGGKWLCIEVTDGKILDDVKKILAARVPPKKI